jgi:sortase A
MDEQSTDNHFDASMPLPNESGGGKKSDEKAVNPAADLIRQKVQAAYGNEPDAIEEAEDEAERGSTAVRSKHQQFLYGLTTSGQYEAEIRQAWHDYYAGLTDVEKHQVWQEFYSSQSKSSSFSAKPALEPATSTTISVDDTQQDEPVSRTYSDVKKSIAVGRRPRLKSVHHFQSLLFGLGVGSIVILIFLFSFFNERFIAPFIQPSRNVTNTPIIGTNSTAGNTPEVIIPKINVEIPVVYDLKTIDESAIEGALENGVVHYADTSVPGQNGNVAIVGHSSNNIFNQGKYKFAFVLLSRLEKNDTFYLTKGGKRYTYEVYEKKIVKPTDVSVLFSTNKPATATLITCDPPGTSTNRLVVIGEQISPSPSGNVAAKPSQFTTQSAIIPGNSPSLWSRLVNWFAH